MRFLVITKARTTFPIDLMPQLFEGMKAWSKKYIANKKMEQAWGFAGTQGGGGILNVNSNEELDMIMSEFPLALWSDTEIHALADLERSLDNALTSVRRMTPVRA